MKERRRIAARRDEFDPGHEDARGVLLAEEDRSHNRVHESRAERARETPAFGAHQVDVRLAVDLRAAEEDIDATLPARSKAPRAFAERIAFPSVQPGHSQRHTPRPRSSHAAAGMGEAAPTATCLASPIRRAITQARSSSRECKRTRRDSAGSLRARGARVVREMRVVDVVDARDAERPGAALRRRKRAYVRRGNTPGASSSSSSMSPPFISS